VQIQIHYKRLKPSYLLFNPDEEKLTYKECLVFHCDHHQGNATNMKIMKQPLKTRRKPTLGGDPLDSSIATPTMDMRAPNQVCAGTIAPSIPSSKGTTIT